MDSLLKKIGNLPVWGLPSRTEVRTASTISLVRLEVKENSVEEKDKKAQQNDEVSKNPRWIKTLSYLFSQHVSDWKLAIIEADSMLDELMTELSFKGDSLGDKLKNATQDKFRGLSLAWEVHTIRNRIAHEGMNYEITQREAKRVIAIYESIFREFGFI